MPITKTSTGKLLAEKALVFSSYIKRYKPMASLVNIAQKEEKRWI
jgi:hypothetical protein